MKKIVLFLLMFFASDVYAQSPYVDGATVTADGITFEVNHIGYTLRLSNIANMYDSWPLYYKENGRELETEAEYASIGAKKINLNSAFRALREVLEDDVIKALRKERYSPMTICYTISSDGETLEVSFIMRTHPLLLTLSPEKYASLEKMLKQYVKWQPNEFSKGLRYFYMSDYIDFNKVPISGELYPYPKILPAPDEKLPLNGK